MKTLSAQFDEMIVFDGVVVFLQIFGIFTQNQIFSIYYVIFSYLIVGIPLTMNFYTLFWLIAESLCPLFFTIFKRQMYIFVISNEVH